MSMSMPTLNVCTLSNIRVASNTHHLLVIKTRRNRFVEPNPMCH
jgi:hypothetical protein